MWKCEQCDKPAHFAIEARHERQQFCQFHYCLFIIDTAKVIAARLEKCDHK